MLKVDKTDLTAYWIVAILITFVKGIAVYFLWNDVISSIVGLPAIGFWKAILGMFLVMILSLKFTRKQ